MNAILRHIHDGGWLMVPLVFITYCIWCLYLTEWYRLSKANAMTEEDIQNHRGTLQFLGALVASAPLVGLLGTVLGMIRTFHAVSSVQGDTAQMVADGIRLALVTTEAGLVAAIPGALALAHLKRKLAGKRH